MQRISRLPSPQPLANSTLLRLSRDNLTKVGSYTKCALMIKGDENKK